MQLIVTHLAPDFDAVASLALAKLLHKDALAVLPGGADDGVNTLIGLYRDVLNFAEPGDVDSDAVTGLIVVDTASKSRIRPFDALAERVPVTLYDHHPRPQDALPATGGVRRELGAAASILTLLLERKGMTLSPELASVALLGIHADTGHLSYASTRSEDAAACAYLLAQGADLALVRRFMSEAYEPQQRQLFWRLLSAATELTVGGRRVLSAKAEQPDVSPKLAPIAAELLEWSGADAVFALVRMDATTHIVARAGPFVDVGAALSALGGGGHKGAAYAATDLSPAEAEAELLSGLVTHVSPPLRAQDVMSSPVKTVRAGSSVSEAIASLTRYGHNGLAVLDEVGRLTGVVSRRSLDRALRHGLGNAPVSGQMTHKPVTAPPDAPLPDIEALILEHNVGRIPILKDGELVGIVTRSDLLASKREAHNEGELLERLPYALQDALRIAAELSSSTLYLVGGAVRDLILGTPVKDADVVVEGRAEVLAKALAESLDGEADCHPDFGTCTLRLPNGVALDIASARDEYYEHPGALPQVTAGSLSRDLARRDFSLNALALRLSPQPVSLFDPFGGRRDLEKRELRVLHPLSFVEDPTRIVRGARLAGRLGLRFAPETADLIKDALKPEVLNQVSAARFRSELELTLAEPRVLPALNQLSEQGALSSIFGLRGFDKELMAALDEAETTPESYLLALLLNLSGAASRTWLTRFGYPLRLADSLTRLQTIRRRGHLNPEQFGRLGEAERALLRVFSSDLAARLVELATRTKERGLTGSDVIGLGLPEGPQVGQILSKVAEAKDEGKVTTFEEELELAKQLISQET